LRNINEEQQRRRSRSDGLQIWRQCYFFQVWCSYTAVCSSGRHFYNNHQQKSRFIIGVTQST